MALRIYNDTEDVSGRIDIVSQLEGTTGASIWIAEGTLRPIPIGAIEFEEPWSTTGLEEGNFN